MHLTGGEDRFPAARAPHPPPLPLASVDISGDVAQVRSEVVNRGGQAVAEATGIYRVFESGRRSFKPALAPEAEREEMRR